MIDAFADLFQAAFEGVADWLFAPSPKRPKTTVPMVIGYSVEQGQRILDQYELRLRLVGPASDLADMMITSQKPIAGTQAREGSAVIVRAARP
jgi:beta-lactam-binding protein with PASTA domain